MNLKSISFLVISLVLVFNYITLPLSFYKIKQPNNEEIKQLVSKAVTEQISLKSNFIEAGEKINAKYSFSIQPLIFAYVIVLFFLWFIKKLLKEYQPWLEKYQSKNSIINAIIFNCFPAKKSLNLNKIQCKKLIILYSLLNFLFFPIILLIKYFYLLIFSTKYAK